MIKRCRSMWLGGLVVIGGGLLVGLGPGCETTPTSTGGAAGGGSSSAPTQAQLNAAAGYELLYGVVSKQRNVAQLFGLKKPSPAVKSIVTEIGEASGDLYQWMEDNRSALEATGVNFKADPLPTAEQKARASIDGKSTRSLLFGRHWERDLTLSMTKSTEYLAALADATAGLETDATRAKELKRFAETMRSCEARLLALVRIAQPPASSEASGG
ncbi:MAG: hypothetical protein AAGB29_03065 [Planctomycetota bacterium]